MKEENPEPDILEYKIITLGDPAVGKTSIIKRFLNEKFDPNEIQTLDMSYTNKIIKVNEANIKLNLVDTAGQEKFRAISLSYLRHTDVVLFIFDLNRENSFEGIQYWIDLFNENEGFDKLKGKYLVGNKNDLEQNVNQNLIDDLVKNNNLTYISTSAKTKNQIDEMFQFIGEELYEYDKKNKTKGSTQKGKVLSQRNNNKGQCCQILF